MFCQRHQLGQLWMNHTYSHLLYQVKTQLPKHTKKLFFYRKKKRLTVLHKTQSISNISNISIYVHLHATEKCSSRRVLSDIFCTNFKTIDQITSIYMTNKLVTITQSCLGACLYSAGAQHRNLLKLLVMNINRHPNLLCYCHQFISHIYACDLINCVLKFVQKASQRTLLEVHFSVACK